MLPKQLRGWPSKTLLIGALFGPCAVLSAQGSYAVKWKSQAGTTDGEVVWDCAAGAGGIFLVGESLSVSGIGGLLMKFDSAGAHQWTTILGEELLAVTTTSEESVFVAGFTMSNSPGPLFHANGMVAKLTPSGAVQWKQEVATDKHDRLYSIAVDESGFVYACGHTSGSLASQNAGSNDAIVAKFDSVGSIVWIRQLGTPKGDSAHGVVVASDGSVYVAGETSGDLGGTSKGQSDVFLAKYDSTGELMWVVQSGSDEDETCAGLAIDTSGNLYVAGDHLSQSPSADFDAFVTKLSENGDLIWHSELTVPNSGESCYAIACNQNGIYLGGTTDVSVGPPPAGDGDAFAAKFSLDGVLQWTLQFGSPKLEEAHGIALTENGDLIVAGYTYGPLAGTSLGNEDAFVICLGPDECQPDCDESASLDFFDFLCFQSAFALGLSSADCDENGVLDLQDFLCFQSAFAAGCP